MMGRERAAFRVAVMVVEVGPPTFRRWWLGRRRW